MWSCCQELVQNEINEPGKNATEPFATRECENVKAIILRQCDKRKLHLYCAANKHNIIFFRTSASGKAYVIQTGKVSKHFK